MTARLLLLTVALVLLGDFQVVGRTWRVHRDTMALRRCRRLLARSDAAREAGHRVAAERLMRRATAALP